MKRTRVRQYVERLTGWRQLLFWCQYQYPMIDPAVFQYADRLRAICEMIAGMEPTSACRLAHAPTAPAPPKSEPLG